MSFLFSVWTYFEITLFSRENKVQKKSGFAGVEEHPWQIVLTFKIFSL